MTQILRDYAVAAHDKAFDLRMALVVAKFWPARWENGLIFVFEQGSFYSV